MSSFLESGAVPVVRLALSACLVLAGCGGEAGERALAEGRYRYVASRSGPGQSGTVRLEGVLVITNSGADSIAGRWEVPQLQPDLQLGDREAGSYEVMASPIYFGVLTHRIRPGPREGEILCEGDYTWVADGGVERSEPVTCSISRDAGERPEMPARGAEDPIVRSIDADTLPPQGVSPDARSGPRPDSTVR